MVNKAERIDLTAKGLITANNLASAPEGDRIALTSKGLSVANTLAGRAEPTDDQLSRIDLLANLALQGRSRKVLKCNVCGVEYSGWLDFAYAESMRTGWAASCRTEGREPLGVCPCHNRTCQGELVIIEK